MKIDYRIKYVHCPIYNEEIDERDCFDITMTAEGLGPTSLDKKLKAQNENYENICLNCPNHRE